MANKQVLKSLKVNLNLFEINQEYPSLNVHSIDRHLCANTKPLKTVQSININKLFNPPPTTDQEKEKNSKTIEKKSDIIDLFQYQQEEKDSKNIEQKTEVIDLFQYQQEEEVHQRNKLYKKYRYQSINSNNNNNDDDDEEIRDNKNE